MECATTASASPSQAEMRPSETVSLILYTLQQISCMPLTAVMRIVDAAPTVYALHDSVGSGLRPGHRMDLPASWYRSPYAGQATLLEHASADAGTWEYPLLAGRRIESYICAPIVTAGGMVWGYLVAVDHVPARPRPHLLATFKNLAALMGRVLDEEHRLNATQDTLREERAASKRREQFIAILCHDLRNPLHAILANADLLGRHVLASSHVTRLAARIKATSARMAALIEDVLDLSRGRLGDGLHMQTTRIPDLESALRAVVKELQEGQPRRHIKVNVALARPVQCDLRRIQQVVSNLIGNALTHGDADKTVAFSASTDDVELILEVWNQGNPIPPEVIEKVFEPFWRGSATRDAGLGLGLHICAQIVRAHGGRISVSSSEATGTQFTVRLPLQHPYA